MRRGPARSDSDPAPRCSPIARTRTLLESARPRDPRAGAFAAYRGVMLSGSLKSRLCRFQGDLLTCTNESGRPLRSGAGRDAWMDPAYLSSPTLPAASLAALASAEAARRTVVVAPLAELRVERALDLAGVRTADRADQRLAALHQVAEGALRVLWEAAAEPLRLLRQPAAQLLRLVGELAKRRGGEVGDAGDGVEGPPGVLAVDGCHEDGSSQVMGSDRK